MSNSQARSLYWAARRSVTSRTVATRITDQVRQAMVLDAWGFRAERSSNPITSNPRRYWSQADEDGIIERILTRIGPDGVGRFVEFGVGNGSECNTLALLARGWRGAWISGEDLMFAPRPGGRLVFQKQWITLENIVALTRRAIAGIGGATPDVVSLDLDGNDYHFTSTLLDSGIRPRIWISEYNARFPVGSHWVMDYDPEHRWASDDYFGASLSAFADLFDQHGYFPVACSAQGANAFFVSSEYRQLFHDVPDDLSTIYQPPFPGLAPTWGNRPSARTLTSLT